MSTAQTTFKNDYSLLEWSAPSRPYKERSQEYFKTIAALVFLIAVILFFAKEYLLILAVFSVAFVAYALASVPPDETTHRITKLGIETGGVFHRWSEFRDFWFDSSHDQSMLVVHTHLPFPSRLFLLLNSVSEEKVKNLLSEHIPYREQPDHTFLDRAARWLSRKIPLEKPAS